MRKKGRRNGAVKGVYGITAPGGAGAKGGKGGKGGAGSSRAGALFAPPSMKKPPGVSKAATSRKNNDGNLSTRQSPYKRPRDYPPF